VKKMLLRIKSRAGTYCQTNATMRSRFAKIDSGIRSDSFSPFWGRIVATISAIRNPTTHQPAKFCSGTP